MEATTATPEKYRAILDGLGQVPTLPAIVAKVLEVINHPTASADAAAQIIGKDLALSAKVLRLVNSAFYGIPRTISSIDQAVIILGFQTVRSLVMSASVMKMLGRGGRGSLDRRRVWRHSVGAALAARMVARRQRRLGLDAEALFMAGLLHKIGVLVLDGSEDVGYAEVLREALTGSATLPELERRHLGIDHAAIGGLLAEKWGLPDELKEPIRRHLDPLGPELDPQAACVVHLASHLVERAGIAAFEGHVQWVLDPAILEVLGFHEDELVDLQLALEVEIEKAEAFFALIDAG